MAKNERLRIVLEELFNNTPNLTASKEMIVRIQTIGYSLNLPISQSTAYRWITLYKTQGHLKRKLATGRPINSQTALKNTLTILLIEWCQNQYFLN